MQSLLGYVSVLPPHTCDLHKWQNLEHMCAHQPLRGRRERAEKSKLLGRYVGDTIWVGGVPRPLQLQSRVAAVSSGVVPSSGVSNVGRHTSSVAICRKMSTTQKGHSYLTRRLVFGLPSYQYKANKEILVEHMHRLALDMVSLFETGVRVNTGNDQTTYYGVLIGIKGDMKFHAETAGFTRCYSNLSKKGNTNPMCAWCLAGSPDLPF